MKSIRDVLLFLNIARFSNIRTLELIKSGDINYLLNLNYQNVDKIDFINSDEKLKLKNKLINYSTDIEINKLDKKKIKFTTILDKNYPEKLKKIYNPPVLIYYLGKEIDILNNCLAIVGTRKPTNYGIWSIKKIIFELKKYDIQIVSGMASGIDYYAHNEAINNDILTIGVLASSLDIEYPKINFSLYRKMENQILISEFPLGTYPLKINFVLRNRIISGLSFGTLIVEAASKSGSLITANYSIEQNREVYAIPGNINSIYSNGCNQLIKNGAKLVENASDIIDELSFIKEVESITNYNIHLKLDDKEMRIFNVLSLEIMTIDEISNKTGIEISELYSILTKMEINDIIYSDGNKFILK